MKIVALIYIFFIGLNSSQAQTIGDSKAYAIILSGGVDQDNNHYRFYDSTVKLHKTYEARGIKNENIFTLFASGNSNLPDTLVADNEHPALFNAADAFSKNENFNLNGAATKEDLKKTFLELSKKVKKGDVINFFVTDHGSEAGDVLMWGTDKNTGTLVSLSVNELKDLLKLLPSGVTTQIATNMCYGGKLMELTDTASDICVVSSVDDKNTSKVPARADNDEFVDIYAKSLKSKNFYDAYADAKLSDKFGNDTSTDSLDFYIRKQLLNQNSKIVNIESSVICTNDHRQDLKDLKKLSRALSKDEDLKVVLSKIEKNLSALDDAKKSEKIYLKTDYEKKHDDMMTRHRKAIKMLPGDERTEILNLHPDQYRDLKNEKFEKSQPVVKLTRNLESLNRELLFLRNATSEEKENYHKIKKCLERSL